MARRPKTAPSDALADALDNALTTQVKKRAVKRGVLETHRDRIRALRNQGRTWASIADVLEAAGMKVTVSYLIRITTERLEPTKKTVRPAGNRPPTNDPSEHPSPARFGAAGVKF